MNATWHLHMSAGNAKGKVFGERLSPAIVSATCKLIITIINGVVDRHYHDAIGLNLFQI